MKVYALDYDRETIALCGEVDGEDTLGCRKFLDEFFQKINFKSYYQRYFKDEFDNIICDFGSHTVFLVFEQDTGSCKAENYFRRDERNGN